MSLVRWADEHPVRTLACIAGLVYIGLLIWAQSRSAPLLLADASPDHRMDIYSEFASTAVALLAVALTVLAILLALPDRPAVSELREGESWARLQGTLLAAALFCLITLVASHLGAAIDDKNVGKDWLGLLAFVGGAMSIVSVLLGGVVFALFLHVSQAPADPSVGRGE
jgi:heme A synthase